MPDLAFRSAGDPAHPAVLLVHGYPASSYMWARRYTRSRTGGLYALAPDLAGLRRLRARPAGDVGAPRRGARALPLRRLGRVALVGHDWGGLIGLRWACEHPDAVWAVVASDTGFFPDGRWHGHGRGAAHARPGRGAGRRDDRRELRRPARHDEHRDHGARRREYFKAFADEPRRRGQLELYRSRGLREARRLRGQAGRARRAVPGAVGRGGRVRARRRRATASRARSPAPRSQVIPGSGHFVYEDAPAGERARWPLSPGSLSARRAQLRAVPREHVVGLVALVDRVVGVGLGAELAARPAARAPRP